ncbi:hypothetical protein J3459_014107 [Metarhizium acridum]|nr:hypothetical protein J3459_014107 [Metarhizium acridum]
MPAPIPIPPSTEVLLRCSESADVRLQQYAKGAREAEIVVAVVGVGLRRQAACAILFDAVQGYRLRHLVCDASRRKT